MGDKSYLPDIKFHTENIISCKNDYYVMKQSIDGLYKIFSSITGIEAHYKRNDEIILSTGKAISSSSAAHCLIEIKRTAIFLRGIKRAIDYKLGLKVKPLRILYAGCGPYATLVIPLLTLYSSSDLKITLIDINKNSFDAAKNLLQTTRLEHFIDEFLLTDATNYIVKNQYDIVISETMRSCLEKEPQIHIMKNLMNQMPEETIFIPEKVIIDAYLISPSLTMESKLYENRNKNIIWKKHLGKLFEVSKKTLNFKNYSGIVQIPEETDIFPVLKLFTEIYSYKTERLGSYDCSLTIPKPFYDFRINKHTNKFKFRLNTNGAPKIEWETFV